MSAIDISRFARRLLHEQYHLVLNAEPGVLAGRIEPLHDLRVAIRRIRNLLKAFRVIFPGGSAGALEARFRKFSKQLGPARDMDVWMRTLKSLRNPASVEWRLFVGHQRDIQKRKKTSLRRVFEDPSHRSLMADFELFLDQPAARDDVTLAALGARAVRKSLDRVMDRSRLEPSFPARKAHLLRIACRRARYMAEFFTATLGRPVARLARRLKAVQDVLGDIHDCDICLAHLRRPPAFAPPELVAELNRRRRAHVARFGKVWKMLEKATGWRA